MRRPYHPYLYPSVSVSIGNKREGIIITEGAGISSLVTEGRPMRYLFVSLFMGGRPGPVRETRSYRSLQSPSVTTNRSFSGPIR